MGETPHLVLIGWVGSMTASSCFYEQKLFRTAEETENFFGCVPIRPAKMIDTPFADGECLDNEVNGLEIVDFDDTLTCRGLFVFLKSNLDLNDGNYVTVTCYLIEIRDELNAHFYVLTKEFGLDPT